MMITSIVLIFLKASLTGLKAHMVALPFTMCRTNCVMNLICSVFGCYYILYINPTEV